MDTNENFISFKKAIIIIVLVTFTITTLAFSALFTIRRIKQSQKENSQYNIVAIVQCCNVNESLKTSFFAEVLQLSTEVPTNLFSFSTIKAQKQLANIPVLKNFAIKKIKPGTIFIDYSLRTPIAYLKDVSNTLIDEECVCFPAKPFFTPKNLPEIYLGLEKENLSYGSIVKDLKIDLAFEVLKYFSFKNPLEEIELIDVSNAFANSYGKREVVLIIKGEQNHSLSIASYNRKKFLRLNAEDYPQSITNYISLQNQLNDFNVIDLRLNNMAFLSKEELKITKDNYEQFH